jgi:hypothetical protein
LITETRSAETFRYSQEILQQHGSIDRVLGWCQNECINEWRWRLLEFSGDRQPGRYVFYFDSEHDACAFALKWS